MPAPDGANTVVEALSRLNVANIELTDIALRRPSLDEVFLSLTKDSTQPATPDQGVEGDQSVDTTARTSNGSGGRHRLIGRRSSQATDVTSS